MKLSSEHNVYLDANFFIFALLDKTVLGESAREIYQKIIDKKFRGVTSSLSLDEILWVLIKSDKRHLLRDVVDDIYRTVSILPVSVSAPIIALDEIFNSKLNPRDAFHVAVMQENDIDIIISDDQDFKKVKGIKWHDFKSFLGHIEKG